MGTCSDACENCNKDGRNIDLLNDSKENIRITKQKNENFLQTTTEFQNTCSQVKN